MDLPQLSASTESAAADALVVLARADERIGERGGYLNHLLIRSESISSSWIEGNRVSPKKLAVAEALRRGDRVALDVVANVRATEEAIADLADRDRPITAADIEALQHVIEPGLPFGVRQEQNWVGGPGWSPLRADFVPPPEGEVPRLLDNLADFVTATSGNPVVRAALAHAQFETIHPFIDGNGRTGRALIHTVLRRADALRNLLVPISTVFAGAVDGYIDGLTAFRDGDVDSWVDRFCEATELAAANAVRLSQRVEQLDHEALVDLTVHRHRAGLSPASPRRDSVAAKILGALASEPVLTIQGVSSRYRISATAATNALTQLTDAAILSRVRNHRGQTSAWTADRHLALVALTERSNRVGGGDTARVRPRLGPPAPDEAVVGRLHDGA
ncbi:Fic family protein [Frondihabitans australicus]|uniref:Fic family protein n=1 Tax=Frondihabitans australicus TaxID=386892 RepID=UPI001FE4E182|nr:Fic family protein [Frondihabitans australicus]